MKRVLAYTMTNENLGKIACGIIGQRLHQAASHRHCWRAERSLSRREEIELFGYRETAPEAYYAKMEANVKLLRTAASSSLRNRELQGRYPGRKKLHLRNRHIRLRTPAGRKEFVIS